MSNNINTLSERIKNRLNELGKKQADLARDTGLTSAAVNQWIKGNVKRLSGDSLIKVAAALQVSPAWLNTGEGSKLLAHEIPTGKPISALALEEGDLLPSDYVSIPEYILTISAGNGSISESENPDSAPAVYRLSWLIDNGVNPKYARRYKVYGDSMIPTLFDGDTILVDISQTDPKHIRDGAVYAIRFSDMLKVKRLRRKLNGVIVLISDNPAYPPEEIEPQIAAADFAIIGRVIERSGTAGL